jgi:glycosyltransferase involved in cell wall biosynthesis
MNIAYIDLQVNFPFLEDYSIAPKRYGGGSCFAKFAKIYLNGNGNYFRIYGSKANFENVSDDEGGIYCSVLNQHEIAHIRNGGRVKDVIPESIHFDIICFHHDCMTLNTQGLKVKLVHWALMGDGRANHPSTPYTLLYNPGESAQYGKSYPINIGTFIPSVFMASKIDDYIFQCSRHDGHQNTIEVAKLCLDNQIKGYFAGPILDNYPLMDYIDNKTTFYLGLVDEPTKVGFTKSALMTTYLHKWETAFNLSVISSLGYGTPIFANNVGCFKYLLKDGVNGFVNDGRSFLEIVELAKKIDRKVVWETALPYSHTAMVDSFYRAFEQILRE